MNCILDLYLLTELFFLMRQNTLLRIRAHMMRSFCSCKCTWRWCNTTGRRMYLESGEKCRYCHTCRVPHKPHTDLHPLFNFNYEIISTCSSKDTSSARLTLKNSSTFSQLMIPALERPLILSLK